MTADHAVRIILHGYAGRNAVLHPFLIDQLINVIAGLLLPDELSPLDHAPQQVMCLLIYGITVHVHILRKLCLRTVDPQK